jgi:hypothetical protein
MLRLSAVGGRTVPLLLPLLPLLLQLLLLALDLLRFGQLYSGSLGRASTHGYRRGR